MRNLKFLGVYSKNSGGKHSGGAVARQTLYFVWQVDDTSYVAQELDKALLPKGGTFRLTAEQLEARLRFEPSILAAPISTPDFHMPEKPQSPPRAAELTDSTLRELEKARKAKQLENDLRNNFSKALRALNRPRDRKGALAVLEQLAITTKGIMPVHKHMFRDFGVSLRKKSLPDLALQCARRVVELSPNDDHAHFNIARILEILGLYDEALEHLRKADEINKNEPVYGRLRSYILRQKAARGLPD